MGFFRFTNTTTNSTADTIERKPVVLQLNEEQITIPATEAAGKSIGQLFQEHSDQLGGDASRISRYVAAGQIISQDTVVQLGTIYRGAVLSESKGLR